MTRLQRLAVFVSFALCLLLAASTAGAATRPDAWITTKVKLGLLTTQDVHGLDIDVDTVNGNVILHGFVSTEAESDRAQQIARGIEGVRDVRNLLQVKPEAVRDQIEASDDQVRKQVENVLERDAALKDSDVEVASVTNGVVVLSGSTRSLSDHLRAVEDAKSVEGVRRVASEIESPDSLADDEIWHDGAAEQEAASMRDSAQDLWITTAAKLRLITDDATPGLSVNVDTRDGVVTLFGRVPSDAAKAAAEAQVRKVKGVRAVENELQVVPAGANESVARSDDEIAHAVNDAIGERSDLDDASIDVEAANGVVRLSGQVISQTDRVTALTVASQTPGVRKVVDDLRVLPSVASEPPA